MFFRLFERLFVVVLLLCSMNVVGGLTRPSLTERDPDLISTQVHLPIAVTEAGVYAWGAVLILLRGRRVLNAARSVAPLVALMALAPLSMLWSAEPMLSVQRSAAFVGSSVLAIYLGERYSIEKLARLLAQTLCLMMLFVVAVYFVAPSYVVDYSTHVGAWKGLSEHKNLFGEYMAIAVALLLLVRFHHFRWLRYVFLFGAALLLVLSRSATALISGALIVAAMPLWQWARRPGKHRLLIYTLPVLLCFPLVYLISNNTGPLLQLLGRDFTFSGRTQLWSTVLPAIAKHPILGYGYEAFWSGFKGESLQVMLGSGWLIGAAHNGFLDLCLSFGIVGVCLFAYVFIRCFRMAIDFLKSESGSLALWPVTYLCFFVLHNLFESALLTRRALPFLLFATITTSLALHRRRLPGTSPALETERQANEWDTAGTLTEAPALQSYSR